MSNLIKLNTKLIVIPFILYLGLIANYVFAEANFAEANVDIDDEFQQVTIKEPFIELHTGPGRGFPVFFIVEKGDKLTLIKKKTQWYKVETSRGKQGWIFEDEMEKTFTPNDEYFSVDKLEQDNFVNRNFDAGILAGDFGGATVMTLYSGWNWTPNITTELAFSQAIGNVSDSQLIDLSVMHQAFPEWLVSPYIKIGTGIIKIKPHATLVTTEDRKDEFVHAGLGMRIYITRQFSARLEYNSYTILTSRNDNDQIGEWKLGFSVFF